MVEAPNMEGLKPLPINQNLNCSTRFLKRSDNSLTLSLVDEIDSILALLFLVVLTIRFRF